MTVIRAGAVAACAIPGVRAVHARITGAMILDVPGFDEPYLYLRDLPGLIAMVQMGVLEMHPWAVTVDHPDRADGAGFAGFL